MLFLNTVAALLPLANFPVIDAMPVSIKYIAYIEHPMSTPLFQGLQGYDRVSTANVCHSLSIVNSITTNFCMALLLLGISRII